MIESAIASASWFVVMGYAVTTMGPVVTARADTTTDRNKIYYVRILFAVTFISPGIGSVYCVLMASLSDHTAPEDRASAMGVNKLWMDSGYAFGGLLTGWIADASSGSFL